jgi:hypothetical protein
MVTQVLISFGDIDKYTTTTGKCLCFFLKSIKEITFSCGHHVESGREITVHNIRELELHAAQRKIVFRLTEKANLYKSVRNVLKQKRWIIWYGPLSRTWHGCMHAHIQ